MSRSVAADDASWRWPTHGTRLCAHHRNANAVCLCKTNWQLCGSDTERGLQWRQATVRTHYQAGQFFVALLAGGGRTGGRTLVRRACSTAWRCKSSSQPDRGEVIAKRKGVAARRGLKEAWSKNASQCTRTGSEA